MTFFVPGVPAPQGSKRHVGNGILIESSKKVQPWREAVAWVARKHFKEPIEDAVLVEFEFVLPRTKRMGDKIAPPMIQKPDIDKLARSTCDGLSGVAYKDDSQIVSLYVRKRRARPGEGTGAHIQVHRIRHFG